MAKNLSKIFFKDIGKYLPNNLERKNNMKIIDLLNKIANGEEVPKKIKYDNIIYEYDEQYDYKNELQINYYSVNRGEDFFNKVFCYSLNEKVEIIEDNKKIEKIDIISDEATPNSYYILNEHGTKCYMTKHSKVIADKLNETIDKLKEVLNDKN